MRKEFTLKILNMDCTACVSQLQKLIEREPGVQKVSINYLSGMAAITCETDIFYVEHLVSAIERIGYSIPRETMKLKCLVTDNQVSLVETVLNEQFGVEAIHFDCTEGVAVLTLFPVGTNAQAILDCFTEIGISCELIVWDTGEETAEISGQLAMLRRLLLSAALSIPLFWNPSPILQFVLATILQFGPGRYFYQGLFRSIRGKQLNMDVLIAASTTVIYLYSSWIAFTAHEQIKLYFLGQGVLISLIFFGKYLEILTKGQTSQALRTLIQLQPQKAVILTESGEAEIAIETIQVGNKVIVRSGERIPVDGIILSGECIIDESMVTGESELNHKTVGAQVIGGTLNREGAITISVNRVGEATTLQQMISIVRQAQFSKPPIQNLADRIAGYFIPAVLIISIVVFCIWYFFLTPYDMEQAILTMCGVLVVACPCALGLATPTSIMVGTGRAAELAILFRNAAWIEVAQKADTVVFDKTGTLTSGQPTVGTVRPFGNVTKEELLALAGTIETYSLHPIAHAVTEYCKTNRVNCQPEMLTDVSEQIGSGVTARQNGLVVACGNRALMESIHVALEPLARQEDIRFQAQTELCIARDSELLGVIGISDTIRSDAVDAVKDLETMGMDVWMMTGDHAVTAQAIAQKLGIQNVRSCIIPQEKAALLSELRDHGKTVVMVGDGVNDAPALAVSDVAMAMGGGTDIAKETSGILLLNNRVDSVPLALRLSKTVMKNIRGNLVWALVYNLVCIPLAATGIMNPSIASAAMSFSSIAVLMHALRLKRAEEPRRVAE